MVTKAASFVGSEAMGISSLLELLMNSKAFFNLSLREKEKNCQIEGEAGVWGGGKKTHGEVAGTTAEILSRRGDV